MKIFALFFLLLFNHLYTLAQSTIKGRIIDEKGKPLSSASVYLSGTSYGTLAGTNGNFSLSQIPNGRYDLVVSYSGFNTYSRNIDIGKKELIELENIVLLPVSTELETVTISGGEKGTWMDWGNLFLEYFFGSVPEASKCKLKNPKEISFRHYKSQGRLTARASRPLLIENKALGYNIRYQLGIFEYQFGPRHLLITGYPLFSEMKTNNPRQKAKWEEAREEAYRGSQLHFMRSLFEGTLEENAFEVRMLIKNPNEEKERVKKIMKNRIVANDNPSSIITISAVGNGDSSNYYSEVMRQPDAINYLYNSMIPKDSITFLVNEYRIGLLFENYLHITFTESLEKKEYLKNWLPNEKRAPANPVSLIYLPNNQAVEIEPSGAYYAPEDLLLFDYWAWSQKISTMVPYDYKSNKTKPVK